MWGDGTGEGLDGFRALGLVRAVAVILAFTSGAVDGESELPMNRTGA